MCDAVKSVWNILQPGNHIDREYVDTPIYTQDEAPGLFVHVVKIE